MQFLYQILSVFICSICVICVLFLFIHVFCTQMTQIKQDFHRFFRIGIFFLSLVKIFLLISGFLPKFNNNPIFIRQFFMYIFFHYQICVHLFNLCHLCASALVFPPAKESNTPKTTPSNAANKTRHCSGKINVMVCAGNQKKGIVFLKINPH